MGSSAEACLVLYEESGIINEFGVWLMFFTHLLSTIYAGDLSAHVWKKHGALAGVITTLGHHQNDALMLSSPSFMVSQLRKRMFTATFCTDKHMATLTGRPPALSRRYCTTECHLDLTDEELMAGGQELERILGALDVNGWRTDGKLTNQTVGRAWFMLSQLRDEILELSLGPAHEAPQWRRDEILRRSEQTYKGLPTVLHYSPNEDKSTNGIPPFPIQLLCSLEFLLNKFLLLRLPDDGLSEDKKQENKQELVDTARLILERVNLKIASREQRGSNLGIVWATVYFGLNAAGLLGVELLRQSAQGKQYVVTLPRSKTIQNLSIFLGCLHLIRPFTGHYKLCARTEKVLRRILDHLLDPVPGANPTPTEQNLPELVPDVDMSTIMGLTDDSDLTQWLNSIDWTNGSWIDSYSMAFC